MTGAIPFFRSSFIWRDSSVAALGGLLFGYDTAIISGAVPLIRYYFRLSDQGLGWAVGSILIGCAMGALLAGALMDARGRRLVLYACAILFALSGVGVGMSTSLSVFVAFRIVGGLAVGAAAMVSPVYIAEMAPAGHRGRLVSVYQLAIVTGILAAYAVNYGLVSLGAASWRWMFASQAFPAVLFFLLLTLVPETPRWLAGQGRDGEALDVLRRIEGPDGAAIELMRIKNSFTRESRATAVELLSGRYRMVLLTGLLLAVFQQVTGINAILYYAPVIFRQTGVGSSSALAQTICIGAVNLLTTFIAIGLVDRVGRRQFLLWGSVVMGLSLVIVAGCFHYGYFSHYVILLFTLIYVAAFGATLGAVTWVYLSEIFPNRIRGIALSAATLVLWLADFTVTYTFPVMSGGLGTAATLCIYAGLCGLAALFFLKVLPETKGKTLEQIEQLLIK